MSELVKVSYDVRITLRVPRVNVPDEADIASDVRVGLEEAGGHEVVDVEASAA